MLRSSVISGFLAAVFAATAFAQATEPPPIRLMYRGIIGNEVEGFSYKKSMLIMMPLIQKELGITKTQMDRFAAEREAQMIKTRPLLDRLTKDSKVRTELKKQIENDPNPESEKALSDVENEISELRRVADSQFEMPALKVLDRRQLARLEEIQLQLEGELAFFRPEIQQRLNLAPEQVEFLQLMIEESRQQLEQRIVGPSSVVPKSGSVQQRLDHLDKEENKKVLDESRDSVRKGRAKIKQAIYQVLNKNQRAKYEKMLGEPFDFTGWVNFVPFPTSPSLPVRLMYRGVIGAAVEGVSYKKAQLIRMPLIQKELGITKTQMDRYAAEREAQQREMQPLTDRYSNGGAVLEELRRKHAVESRQYPNRPNANPETEKALSDLRDELSQQQQFIRSQWEMPVLRVLDRRQAARLDEIQLQLEGELAFLRPEIQERLNLAPEQVEFLKPMIERARDELEHRIMGPAKVMPKSGMTAQERRDHLDSQENMKILEQARDAIRKGRAQIKRAIYEGLTVDQRGLYEKMLGKPFDFSGWIDFPSQAGATPKADVGPTKGTGTVSKQKGTARKPTD